MSVDLPKRLDELCKIVDRIERIIKYDAPSERGLPARYASNVSSLSINRNSYDSRPDTAALMAANAIKESAINSERIRGERERDAGLKGLALELESLRAVLPSLAANACVEIGVAARSMKQEAER